jgi:ferric-dicitrate binding protein FerR (iron transport regulator)
LKLSNEDLIVRYIVGSLSNEEQASFDALMLADEAFRNEVEAYRQVWEASADVDFTSSLTFNADANWKQFTKETAMPAKSIKIFKPNFHRAFYRVAAVVLLIVSSLFVYQQFGTQNFEDGIVYTNQTKSSVQGLEDGSYVYLADNSNLKMDKRFNRRSRKLRLDGKAFFVVKPDKDRVFEVATDHLTATVKGTTFLVRTDDHSTSVGVNTGIVEVHVGNQTVTLTAGDQLDFSYNMGGVVSRSIFKKDDLNSLKSSVTDYYDTPLKVILSGLQMNRNLSIKVSESIENQRYTLELSNSSDEQILQTLAAVTQTKLVKNGDFYELK